MSVNIINNVCFCFFLALERKISVRANRDELVQKGILLPESQFAPISEPGEDYLRFWLFLFYFNCCFFRRTNSVSNVSKSIVVEFELNDYDDDEPSKVPASAAAASWASTAAVTLSATTTGTAAAATAKSAGTATGVSFAAALFTLPTFDAPAAVDAECPV